MAKNKLSSVLAHQFCIITNYCKVCGQHRELILFRGQPCLTKKQAHNVIAISARRAIEVGEQRTAEVLSELDEEMLLMDDEDLGQYVRDRVDEVLEPIKQRLKEQRERVCRGSTAED